MTVLAADETLSAGPVGLLVVVLLVVATIFLIRSMNSRLRNLPASFEDPKAPVDEDDPPAPGPTV